MDIPQPNQAAQEDDEPVKSAEQSATAAQGYLSQPLAQTIVLSIDGDQSELSSTPQTNSEEELSIPREIISSSISGTSMQSEILRPLFAGTYNGDPAYLLQFQFQFHTRGGGQSWMNRIQSATISIRIDDAPLDSSASRSSTPLFRNRAKAGAAKAADIQLPAILKTFPGPEGWTGPISTAQISREVGVGIQAGWMGIGAGVTVSQGRAKDDYGTASVTTMRTGGKQRNVLQLNVMENHVDAKGIPNFLVVPVVLVHWRRRFSMKVTVKATFGFWRGAIAERVPVLGRADEPVFFDPDVLEEAIEMGKTGIGGVKIAEWKGALEDIDLQELSSLKGA